MSTAPLNEMLPDAVRDFIGNSIVVGDMALPASYPELHQLEAWQVGFRSHGLTGESLVSRASGAWQPGWYVIALNGFDDPFFIDLDEAASGFPVYQAPHGAGRWDAAMAAPNLQRFGWLLSALRGLKDDDVGTLRFIEAEADITSAPWREVCEGRRNREALAEELAPMATDYDPEDFQHGTLIVTDVGPRKLQLVQILRQALDLSLQEALALAAGRDFAVGHGPLIQLRRLRDKLAASGASVEFRPDA